MLDIARSPDEVETADVVVLHRVVCCYPDYQRLLTAAGSKAGRLLVFSHPPRNVATRALLWADNSVRRIKGDSFRSFAHPPEEMLAALGDTGLRPTYRWRGFGWRVVGPRTLTGSRAPGSLPTATGAHRTRLTGRIAAAPAMAQNPATA